jgi:hypothetical protein
MSHWAEIDQDNVVVRVIVADNDDPNNDEGQSWVTENLGGIWVKTSYNGNFRKRFAGIGYTYNADFDAFITPKPFDSWVLEEETCEWKAPAPYPEDGLSYEWNEETLNWELIDLPEEPAE